MNGYTDMHIKKIDEITSNGIAKYINLEKFSVT